MTTWPESRPPRDDLANVQDPANGGSDHDRRLLLRGLYEELGPAVFFAGRMPPPVPAGAPAD